MDPVPADGATPGPPARDAAAIELLVRSRQLDLAYRRLPLSVGLSTLVPLVFMNLMRPHFANAVLAVGLSVVWLATGLRWLLWRQWRRSKVHVDDLRRWSLRYLAVSALAAAAWSVCTLMLHDQAGTAETLMLGIMLFAVTAVGSGSLAWHVPAAAAFILVTLTPFAVLMALSDTAILRVSGLAMMVGVAALLATVIRAGRETAALIRTQLRLSAAVADASDARRVAEQASAAKSEFLANMSHELRTPLTAILGYSELMSDDALDSGARQQVDDLERITKAGRHLLALINDVLDLSKVDAGRMELHLAPTDTAAVVRSAIDTSAPLAAAGGNVLETDGLDSLGTIHADARRLEQVLLNLVGNACKFTSNGRVRVTCARTRDGGRDWVAIAVHDNGIGMTDDQMQHLFTQFMQADTSITRRYGGSGLGLAISQRLCALMGGAITVKSRLGAGSTFTVRLPAEPVAEQAA